MSGEFMSSIPTMRYGEGDRIGLLRQILVGLNHPDEHYPIIHIAGTNGKGSTAQMVTALLSAHQLKVGLFTSPHLVAPRESVQVAGEMISVKAFKSVASQVNRILKAYGWTTPDILSEFEWTFLIALEYFKQMDCDYVVLECGVGGALDATNAITQSETAIFTKIGLDHLNLLGDTLEEIVATKAGIMRSHQLVVIAPEQKPGVTSQLKSAASLLPETECLKADLTNLQTVDRHTYRYVRDNNQEVTITLGLPGEFQRENLATVLTWYEMWLDKNHLAWKNDSVQKALASVHLPGRFEKVNNHPFILMDAAHNLDAITSLIESLQAAFPHQTLRIICGFLKDKDVAHMVEKLRVLPAKWWVTQPDFPGRTLTAEELATIFNRYNISPQGIYSNPKEALEVVMHQEETTPIIILGSFHLIKCLRGEFDV